MMKVVVLGANGRTGIHVVRRALDHGAEVTAIVRSEAKRPGLQHERLRLAVGDPCDPMFLTETFRGRDVVISTLGGKLPTKRATSVYPKSAAAIVEAAANTGLKKAIVTSTALLFPPRRMLDRFLAMIVPHVVQSATRMEEILCAADLAVVVARCGFLTDAEETRYRAAKGDIPAQGSSISRRSLAHFLVDAASRVDAGCQVYGVARPAEQGA